MQARFQRSSLRGIYHLLVFCHVSTMLIVFSECPGIDRRDYMLGVRLKCALMEVWKDAPMDVFDTP
jgi:hypothetical protein